MVMIINNELTWAKNSGNMCIFCVMDKPNSCVETSAFYCMINRIVGHD